MKKILFLILMASSFSSFAYTVNTCDLIHDVAFNAAVARSKGVKLAEVRDNISSKPAYNSNDKLAQQLSLATANLVYNDPNFRGMQPSYVANRMKVKCQLDGRVHRQN